MIIYRYSFHLNLQETIVSFLVYGALYSPSKSLPLQKRLWALILNIMYFISIVYSRGFSSNWVGFSRKSGYYSYSILLLEFVAIFFRRKVLSLLSHYQRNHIVVKDERRSNDHRGVTEKNVECGEREGKWEKKVQEKRERKEEREDENYNNQ